MTINHWVEALFDCEKRAGLRGDPHLWLEIEKAMTLMDQPETVQEFEKLLFEILDELGVDINSPDDRQWLDRYPNDGMSAGYVHLDTWREKNIPLLIERFSTVIFK